jgi:hypothetical protein
MEKGRFDIKRANSAISSSAGSWGKKSTELVWGNIRNECNGRHEGAAISHIRECRYFANADEVVQPRTFRFTKFT